MIKSKDRFADIQPYFPHEVPPAIERMVAVPEFQKVLDYFYEKTEHQGIYDGLKKVKTGFEFQKFFMHRLINRILELSSDGLGLKNEVILKNNGPSVLISNHRDILLDSAILQVVLVDLGLETSEITFGSNLMFNEFIIDFGKVNRMFTVYREGNSRELLEKSKELSAYIHHTITDKKVSSWIAQRKGRTKDGLDKTDTGVLKMLTMYNRKNPIEAFLEINLLPVTVSYEWEPCDLSKVRELFLSEKQKYTKQADEDFYSVINGIINYKGKVSMAFGKPVNEFINENKERLNKQNIHQEVAAFIDQQVIENYQLYPNNYWAYDSLNNSNKYSDKYDEETQTKMTKKLNELYEFIGEKSDEIKNRFLRLYANPLIQKLNSL